MKKILLTILAVLAMSGMAVAQTAPSDINLHRNEDGSWSFIMPGRNLVMSTESFSTNDTVNGHYLAGVPEGWLILALGDTVPVSNDSLRRTTPITEGTPVTIVPTGNLRRIKSITLVDEAPAGPPSWKLTLSSPAKDLCIIAKGGVIAQQTLDVASTEFTVEMPELTSQTVNIVATDGSGNCWYCTQENMSFAIGQTYQSSPTMTALGTESSADVYKMTEAGTIPAGKTVVLSGVTISGGSITCSGNANIILMGSNSVTAAANTAAIEIGGSGTTLTITGSGSLTVNGGSYAAAIGTGYANNASVAGGNIEINGGTITATGGQSSAAIGTGYAYQNGSNECGAITINGGTVTAYGGYAGIGTGGANQSSNECGDITINGGTVTATGGQRSAAIGTGNASNSGSNECGAITISTGVTSVTATMGNRSPNSIGKGYAANSGTQACGTITIGGDATTYADGVTTSPFTYPTAP